MKLEPVPPIDLNNTTRSAKVKQFGLISAVALGVLLNPLNTTMISVAFSRIQEQFDIGFKEISWLIAVYYIASAIGQPVFGKISDRMGPKKVFISGLVLVTLSSLLAPFSPDIGSLIAFRTIQAIGTSALHPSGMSIIRHRVTSRQARALSIVSIFGTTSAALGPTIGGFLIHHSDWQAIFLVNFPVILLSFGLALALIPKDEIRIEDAISKSLDVPGILFFGALITAWFLFLMSLGDGINYWFLAGCLIMGFLFYQYEYRTTHPFIDVRFLRKNAPVRLVYFQYFVGNIVFYSILFGFPSYLQYVRHFDSRETGEIMLAISAPSFIAIPLIGRWIDRSGYKKSIVTGGFVMLVGTSLIWALHEHSPAIFISVVLGVLGISTSFQNQSLQIALYEIVDKNNIGISTGLSMTSRFMGTIFSSCLLNAVFSNRMTTSSLHHLAVPLAAMSVVFVALALAMPRSSQFLSTHTGSESNPTKKRRA